MKKIFPIIIILISVSLFAQNNQSDLTKSSTYRGLKFRNIGPSFTSGRISDIAVNPEDHNTYYVGVASGNVWKTDNAGVTFKPVFDGYGSYSIGCVTVDPNNPHIVWVGTGENNSQRSVGYGDGIYKSEDGGKSFKNMGLKTSEHIAEILVHPENSNIVYAASQGPLWSAGGERGLYKTTDGGENWELILEIDQHTGVSDIAFDPRDPDVIYAASYQRRRHVFTLLNGGPGSAIHKSTDGGKTWKKIIKGLQGAYFGRIGIDVSPVNPDYVYAIVEAFDGKDGFYRSTDRGASWQRMSDHVATSPQYYMEIVCDKFDENKVYSLSTYTMYTEDGGKTFNRLSLKHRHVDDHALWIDPNDPEHLLVGGDGGLYETWDLENFHFKTNLPVIQFYKVVTDNEKPFYYVYGGTQDNNSMGGPSQTININGIMNEDWFITNGGDGFESAVDPENPNIVYAQSQHGWLVRYDKASGERIRIKPSEREGEAAYRWNWDSPLLISPHKNTRLYFCANKVFRSEDRGNSWEVISEDLSRQLDRNEIKVMGRKWSVDAPSKNRSTSEYGNIVAFDESPVKEGLLYAGTDDGLIHVSEDGGKNWRKIASFPGVPDTTYVNQVKASNHIQNRVYAVFNNHKRGDFKPYVLVSNDAGNSWKQITNNLPDRGSVYTIEEDHVNQNLLFVGTEFKVHFSVDGGANWIELTNGLPTIAVRDMDIQERENDLVLASFGRGFYVLDDYSPLREVSTDVFNKEAHIFPIEDALMYIHARPYGGGGKASLGETFYTADNPPFGAVITYYYGETLKTLKQKRHEEEAKLRKDGKDIPYPTEEELIAEDNEDKPYLLFTIRDAQGGVVRRLTESASKGIHRLNWDLRYSTTSPVQRDFSNNSSGIMVMPGKYTIEIAKVVNGKIIKVHDPVEFNTVVLNNTTLPAQDRDAMVKFQKEIAELSRVAMGTLQVLDELKERVDKIKTALMYSQADVSGMIEKADELADTLHALNVALTGENSISSRYIGIPPTIIGRINNAAYAQWASTSAPTETQKEDIRIARKEFAPVYDKIKKILEVDIKGLEDDLEKVNAPWTPGRLPDFK